MTETEKNSESGFRLSLIIPAYNEEKRIGKTMERVVSCIKDLDFPAEVIVVDDGSEDGTRGIVNGFIQREPSVELRLIPADGGIPKTLLEMFGGQGTINVPCWAPDSTKFAFVRYARPNA